MSTASTAAHPLLPLVASTLMSTACAEPAPLQLPDGDPSPLSIEAAWLEANAHPISGGIGGDDSDLIAFASAVAGVRVVVLGAPARLAGPIREVHARLTRHLVEEMGFDLIALDGSFFECELTGRRWIDDPGVPASAVGECLGPHLAAARELQDMWSWLDARAGEGRPVPISGYEPHLSGAASDGAFSDALDGALAAVGSDALTDPGWPVADSILRELDTRTGAIGSLPSPATRSAFFGALDVAIADLEASATPEYRSLGEALDGLGRFLGAEWDLLEAPASDDELVRYGTTIEETGADHLLWLLDRAGPGSRAVVWMPNRSAARDLASVIAYVDGDAPPIRPDQATAGDALAAALGSDVYVLGATARTGTDGVAGLIEHAGRTAQTGDLESRFAEARFEAAFLDFRARPAGGAWLDDPQVSRAFGWRRLSARWTAMIDGVLFVDQSGPVHLGGTP